MVDFGSDQGRSVFATLRRRTATLRIDKSENAGLGQKMPFPDGHYLRVWINVNKAIFLPAILQLVGIVVIIAEIILPSGGILSMIAAGLFGYSLYIVFANISPTAGMFFIVADLIMIPVLVYVGIKFMAKSPVTLSTKLSSKNGVTSQSDELNGFLGCKGKALTDLRPAGMAMLSAQRVDVVTRGEYIEKNTEILVIAVRGNQVVVKEEEKDET